MNANRNGFFYVLDRVTGKFILGKPFVKTTWASEITADGRPRILTEHQPERKRGDSLSGHCGRHELHDPRRTIPRLVCSS